MTPDQGNQHLQKSSLKRVAQGLYRSTASGAYFAHVRIHGKLFRQSLHTTDRKLTDRKLREFRSSREKVDVKRGRVTLESLCDQYEQTLGQLSVSSLKNKRGILHRIKTEWPQGRGQFVSSIRASDCETWLAHQATRVGRSHLNAYLQLLRALLDFALRDRVIAENPAGHMKYGKRQTPIRLTPTWEQFRAIVEEIRNQPFSSDASASADFVEFIGLSGLGQAEANALTCDDVSFENDQITIFRQKTGSGFVIPIFPQLQSLLERLREHPKQRPNGRIFAIKQARKALAGACRRLKFPNYTHRSLRRMFITRAIEKGVDVKVIAQWQGHKDGGKLILDTYSHVNATHSKRMAKRMTAVGADEETKAA